MYKQTTMQHWYQQQNTSTSMPIYEAVSFVCDSLRNKNKGALLQSLVYSRDTSIPTA